MPLDKSSKFRKFNMADRCHFENDYWLYISAANYPIWMKLSMQTQFWFQKWSRDEKSKFSNPSWRTAAILKMGFSRYISRFDFYEIWYADVQFDWENCHVSNLCSSHLIHNSLASCLGLKKIIRSWRDPDSETYRIITKQQKLQFIHVLTATCRKWDIWNSKTHEGYNSAARW